MFILPSFSGLWTTTGPKSLPGKTLQKYHRSTLASLQPRVQLIGHRVSQSWKSKSKPGLGPGCWSLQPLFTPLPQGWLLPPSGSSGRKKKKGGVCLGRVCRILFFLAPPLLLLNSTMPGLVPMEIIGVFSKHCITQMETSPHRNRMEERRTPVMG